MRNFQPARTRDFVTPEHLGIGHHDPTRFFTKKASRQCPGDKLRLQQLNAALADMRNQAKEPLDNTRMKDLWDVPDDFDNPGAKYSIDIGEGIGGEVGYRIVSQQTMAANEVRLTLDYENVDGSSFRREKVLIEDRGRWRVRPVSVTRGKAGN